MADHGGPEGPTQDLPHFEIPRPDPPLPEPPFTLDRYQVRRLIARHGQGTLYEAFDPQLQRTVAIKVVVAASDDRAPDRCEREARALARLQHPNTLHVYDSGPTAIGSRPARYFVSEYLRGARPVTAFAEEHSLSLAERLKLFLPLCDAVGAGHAAGILHRDLKPDNLLVDRSGTPRVIDFGLASGPGIDADESLRRREQGAIVGTPWYLAPEHFERNPDHIDARTDVYSMGVVLYELLTGSLPYAVRGRELGEIARVIREEPPRRPSRADPLIRADLQATLLHALEKDPLRRYASMADLAKDLRRWLQARPVAAQRSTISYRIASALRRFAFIFPVGALAVSCLGAALIAMVAVRPAAERVGLSAALFFLLADQTQAMSDDRSFNVVRAVAIKDDTKLAELATSLGLSSLDPDAPSTFRALWGRIFSRLAEARPTVVAIDIAFSDRDDPGDAELIAGLEALASARCGLVLGLPDWSTPPDEAPALDHDVVSRAIAWGAATGRFHADQPWMADLAVQRPGDEHASPSLALATFAMHRRPYHKLGITISGPGSSVDLRFWGPSASATVRALAELKLPASFVKPDKGSPELGIEPGSTVASTLLCLPRAEAIDAATVDAADLFTMSSGELNSMFRGSVVIIGNGRGDADRHTHPSGRELDGYQVQMAATEGLIRGWSTRRATIMQDTWMCLAGALVGLACAAAPLARPLRRVGAMAIAGAVVFLVSVGTFDQAGHFANPIPILVAMVLAGELAAAAASVRRARGIGSLERLGAREQAGAQL